MERDDAEFSAANERITAMAEELRKAVLVRDRLEELARLMGSCTRSRLGHTPRVGRPCEGTYKGQPSTFVRWVPLLGTLRWYLLLWWVW
jgi:hypothetical protein